MKTFRTMLKIEGKLSIRDMNMVIFAIAMPIVVLIIVGIVNGKKPAFSGAEYSFMDQSFGALTTIAICAGGVMGLPILISEYRERKILKRFQVTPISPLLILLVHICIYAIYALLSLGSLWIIAWFFWGLQIRGSILAFLGGWLLVLVSIFSIGVFVGGIAKNSKSASVIASILYFPMLIFSGATLPYEVMPVPMRHVVDWMPLTQGIKILKSAVLGEGYGSIIIPLIIMITLTVICIGASVRFFRWE